MHTRFPVSLSIERDRPLSPHREREGVMDDGAREKEELVGTGSSTPGTLSRSLHRYLASKGIYQASP